MDKRKIINEQMKLLSEYISNLNINLSNEEEKDGRINSFKKEKNIIEIIEKFYKNKNNIIFYIAPIRYWFDFSINIYLKEYNLNIFVPVNIKLISLNSKTADNASSIKGMLWTFYDYDLKYKNNWTETKKIIDNNNVKKIESSENDYYYLVIDKKNPNKVFFNSIKQLSHITKNSNNLPFQINWCKNTQPLNEQTNLEAYSKVFGAFIEGINGLKKRIDSIENAQKILFELEKNKKV